MEDRGSTIFYTIGLAFALGIFIASFFVVGFSVVTFLVLLAVGLGVVERGARAGGSRPAFFLILTICFLLSFSSGILRMNFEKEGEVNPYLQNLVENKVELEGIVKREPEERGTTTHLYVKTEYGLILVSVYKGDDWSYGDKVRFSGTLKVPEAFETDLGRTFNYPGYLLSRGVSYTVSFAEVELVESGQGNLLLGNIFVLKHAFMNKVEALIPEPAAGLGEGLLLGVKQVLGDELEQTFRRTGIIHIVVLSGYNIMIVVYFILFVLGTIFGRRLSTIFGIVGIVLFALMVGLGASVVRASLMATLLLILGLTGRVYLVLRGLVMAGVLMLIWNPYALVYDVGFQLSFLATLGLILVSPYLTERLTLVPAFVGVREFLVATLATQLFVLPLLLYQIGEFSVVAVIVNVLVLPMVPVAMLLTFITGLIGFVSLSLATPFAYLTYLSLSYIITTATWFGSLPFASFTVPAFPFYMVPLGYGLIALLLWWQGREPDPLSGWVIEEDMS